MSLKWVKTEGFFSSLTPNCQFSRHHPPCKLFFSLTHEPLCSSVPGVCTRPSEIVLLFVGSHGPTMNVYIAKWLSLPALRTAHAYDYGPAHRQTGSRKQEQEAKKHPTQQVQTQGWTRWTDGRTRQTDGRAGGWKRPSLSVQTLPEMQKGRSEKKKKLDKTKKKVTDPYMYQNLEAILLFLIFNPPPCSSSSKWKTMKKVLIFVTSWISLCRHINFSTIR